MEGIREEDHTQHEVQHEEIQEEKTTSQEGTGTGFVRKLGYVSTKDMDLALERNKHLEKECREVNRRLEKLEKTQEHLMSHRDTLIKENATAKEEKMKIEMELQVTLERNKYLEKECREIRERLEKLEKKHEDLMSHRETLSTEKRKIEMELQVTLERNKSLEKECREIRERLDKLEQKQGELMSQRETILIENVTMKEEKRMQEEEKKCGIKESENQSQSVEQEVLMSQLKDLKKSKEEEKAKVKDLKQKQRELELQKNQLQEKIRQCDVDKKQNEAIKAEMLDIQKQLQNLSQDVQKAAENEKVVEDRQKEIWKLYENVDQVRSMYEHKIEELREEMTRLTSRENLKEVLRQANEDQSVMTSDIPVLLQKIRPFFVFCVNPLNVLVIIHSHGPRVLVEQDFQEIQCVTEQRGNIMGASQLLTRLVQYQGWLPCIVKVLRDDRVRRSHVADMIEEAVETIESDEQGAFSSEVKTFLEEKKKQTSQVEMLQKSIEDLKDEMQEKTEQHQRELVNKDQQHNKRLEENNEQHRNQIQCLTRDYEKKLHEERQKQEIQVRKLTEERQKQEIQVRKLTEERQKQEIQVRKLTEERQKQEIQVRKLTDEINLKKKEKEGADKEIEKLQELSQKQEAQVQKLTEEINQKNKEKERADKNTEELQKLSQKQKAEIKTLTEEMRQKNQEKERAEKDIEKLQKKSQKQETQVQKLTEEINQKNKEKEKADKDIEKLKDEVKTNEEKHREDMKSKEEQHRCKSEELEKKIQSYETRIEKLRQEKTELEKMQARTLPVTGFKAQSNCILSDWPYTTIKNYQTVETNDGGHFNPVTGIYTIPVDGKYHVTFSTDYQNGYLNLHHVKVSDKSDTYICHNYSSPFDKGVKQATHEGVMYRGDTLYLVGVGPDIDNVTVRFSVSYLG